MPGASAQAARPRVPADPMGALWSEVLDEMGGELALLVDKLQCHALADEAGTPHVSPEEGLTSKSSEK